MQFDKDMISNQAELFLEVRAFIINCIEENHLEVIEKFTDNLTSYYCKEYNSGFCYIKTKDDYVHIGWFKGVKLEDKSNVLFGNGKIIRGQKIIKLDKLSKEAIKDFIEQSFILLFESHERKLKTKEVHYEFK